MDKVTYTPIPDWILNGGVLSTTELRVFSYMYKGWLYSRSKNREYRMSSGFIAEALGFKEGSFVRKCIGKMEKLGILSVERKRNGFMNEVNVYDFNTEKVFVPDNSNVANYQHMCSEEEIVYVDFTRGCKLAQG